MSRLDKKQISHSFNRAAADYEQTAVLQKTIAGRLLSRLDLLRIAPNRIVDAGSGTGSTARALAKRYRHARVIQVDLSPRMLEVARQKTGGLLSRQQFVCADIEKLPIAAGSVQMVFSSLAYQWCNDLGNALAEVGRILSANGLFLFATLGPDTLRELRDSWAKVDHLPHVNTFYDMHDIGDALLRAGLENVVMDVEIVSMRYPDCVSLMRDLKRVGAQNASQDRQPGLTGRIKLQALQQAYEAYRQAGTLPATYEIVYGHGWAPASGQRIDKPGVTRVPIAQIEGRRKRKNAP